MWDILQDNWPSFCNNSRHEKKEGEGNWGLFLIKRQNIHTLCVDLNHLILTKNTVKNTHKYFYTIEKNFFYYNLDIRWYQQNMVSIVMITAQWLCENMPVSIHAFSGHPEVCTSKIRSQGFALKFSRKEKKKEKKQINQIRQNLDRCLIYTPFCCFHNFF